MQETKENVVFVPETFRLICYQFPVIFSGVLLLVFVLQALFHFRNDDNFDSYIYSSVPVAIGLLIGLLAFKKHSAVEIKDGFVEGPKLYGFSRVKIPFKDIDWNKSFKRSGVKALLLFPYYIRSNSGDKIYLDRLAFSRAQIKSIKEALEGCFITDGSEDKT